MEFTKRHSVCAFLMSLAFAGTCLAAPAAASAANASTNAGSPSPSTTDVAEHDAAQAEAIYALGGVQFCVPSDYEVVDLGSMAIASNASASVVVTVIPATVQDTIPDQDQWPDYFAPGSQAVLGSEDATATDLGVIELDDGTPAYACRLDLSQNDVKNALEQRYIPLSENEFTLVQVAFYTEDDDARHDGEAVLASIARATDAATKLGAVAAFPSVGEVEVGGIAFDLPEGFIADPTAPADEPSWYNEDNTLMLGVMPLLIDGLSDIGDEAFDLIAEGIAQGLGGVIEGSSVLDNKEADVRVYVFAFASEGQEFIGTLGMVPLPDDTVTGILALTPMASAESVNAAITSVFGSIRLTA